ncbi:hypothetical protein BVRB_4g071760 [Beta vulgaris subsp. vulgaris]|nr:hypothetical protein BVRB_4g071760 [Beta vulgaris subsp. vulgaris]
MTDISLELSCHRTFRDGGMVANIHNLGSKMKGN